MKKKLLIVEDHELTRFGLKTAFEDVDYVAPAVLRHRIILSFDAVADNVSADDIIKDMINQ